MKALIFFSLFALAASTPGVAQQIYKCETSDHVTYTSTPCADDAPALDLGPNSTMASGAREAAMEREIERLRGDMRRLQQDQRRVESDAARTPAAGRSRADLHAEMARTPACREATRACQLSANSANQRDVAMRRQAMRAACGMFEHEREPVTNIILR